MTGGRSVLRIEGLKHSNLETGAPNEREAHQPAAPTHARRHEPARVHARYATRLHPRCQEAGAPREYLLVFKDIDTTRAEESSALIGERTSSTSLEFRLGT